MRPWGGSSPDTYFYSVFGVERVVTGSTVNNYRFGGFWGYQRDLASLSYARLRIVDSKTGQWLSRDPIGLWGGDPNLRRYVGNDPVSGVDPSGLAPVYSEHYNTSIDWSHWNSFPFKSTPAGWGTVANSNTTIEGGTRVERVSVALMVTRLFNTKHARSLKWKDMKLQIVLIRGTPKVADDCMGRWLPNSWIQLDLNDNGAQSWVSDYRGEQYAAAPLKIWLGHEMGHALGHVLDNGPNDMNNVIAHENPIRREFGYPPRSRYHSSY